MESPAFAQLVGKLTEALGQSMDSSRRVGEGVLLETTDGFLYGFIEDPGAVSLATGDRLLAESKGGPKRLVLFSSSRLPLAVTERLMRAGASVVEGARFSELVRGLGLGEYLGLEPRPERPGGERRLLPSARVLDELITRAKNWLDWGVPALALRFYRQANDLKPAFAPARIGIASSLLALGLVPEAEAAYREVLAGDPRSIDARLGLAAAKGVAGDTAGELEAYRAMLAEEPDRITVRAHLVAALASHHRWSELRTEVEILLRRVPEDPRLRLLRSLALEHTESAREAAAERTKARELGLTPEAERAICRELGLPSPSLPPSPATALLLSAASARAARSAEKAAAVPAKHRRRPSPPPTRTRKKARSRKAQ
ncbi:MAG: hypothetical protein L3K07_04705 [Thermoplasmata archaeon]|nr:hypothetical protein [Thermoplasmata archaeon]